MIARKYKILITKGAEKDFFRRQFHKDWINAVNLHITIKKGAVTIIIADSNRQIKIGHDISRNVRRIAGRRASAQQKLAI